MTSIRQYVVVKFKPDDRRTYTYHYDGETLAVGDKVIVSTNRGASPVTVSAVSSEKPSFETKPIVGKERPVEATTPTQDTPPPSTTDPKCTGEPSCRCFDCIPF